MTALWLFTNNKLVTRTTSTAETERRAVKSPNGTGTLVRLGVAARSDEELLQGIEAGEPWAAAALLDRYGPLVERLIRRIMGHDPDLSDLVQDAFTTILSSVHQVRDASALKGWIGAVAAHTAHHAIRKRKVARAFCFWKWGDRPAPEPLYETPVGPRDALRRTYAVLDRLPADERVVFTLRYLEELNMNEVAETCGVSLATVKRRLARAEKRFLTAAQKDPVLCGWLREGDRWPSS